MLFRKSLNKGLRPRNPIRTSFVNVTVRLCRLLRRTRTMSEEIEMYEGSGNVYADLELEDADELLTRSQIGFLVFKILENRKLKQREIASVLGIAQPDVSHLMNGHFSRFTTDKLLDFLKRLDQKVTIQVSSHHTGEPYQQVTFTP